VGETLLLDSSAAVALIVEGHPSHDAVLAAVSGARLGLSGHAVFEALSVITRLPGGLRRTATVAASALDRSFPETRFPSHRALALLPTEFARLGIDGGAVFDGLVAAAAREHRLTLVSCDQRALPTYRALGVDVRLVA